jgi:uncharacterized protein (DUF2147 family)
MGIARLVAARVGGRLGAVIWLSLASSAGHTSGAASSGEAGVRGYWREPSGAVIQIAECAQGLCLKIVALSPGDHPHTDLHNPDEKLRGRSLCGLRVGQDFRQTDLLHADGGHVYDPKSGRTYSGSMTAQGNLLKLRGYLGIQLLGRTETWTRAGQGYAACVPG